MNSMRHFWGRAAKSRATSIITMPSSLSLLLTLLFTPLILWITSIHAALTLISALDLHGVLRFVLGDCANRHFLNHWFAKCGQNPRPFLPLTSNVGHFSFKTELEPWIQREKLLLGFYPIAGNQSRSKCDQDSHGISPYYSGFLMCWFSPHQGRYCHSSREVSLTQWWAERDVAWSARFNCLCCIIARHILGSLCQISAEDHNFIFGIFFSFSVWFVIVSMISTPWLGLGIPPVLSLQNTSRTRLLVSFCLQRRCCKPLLSLPKGHVTAEKLLCLFCGWVFSRYFHEIADAWWPEVLVWLGTFQLFSVSKHFRKNNFFFYKSCSIPQICLQVIHN